MNTLDLYGDEIVTASYLEGTLSVFEDDVISCIRSNAFCGRDKLISISAPKCVSVSASAFFGCKNLKFINIQGAEWIRSNAFHVELAYFSFGAHNRKRTFILGSGLIGVDTAATCMNYHEFLNCVSVFSTFTSFTYLSANNFDIGWYTNIDEEDAYDLYFPDFSEVHSIYINGGSNFSNAKRIISPYNCKLFLSSAGFNNMRYLKEISIANIYANKVSVDFMKNAFNLEKFSIPYFPSVTASAFENCYNLRYLSFYNLISIASSTPFRNCVNLSHIIFDGSSLVSCQYYSASNIFESCHPSLKIYVPSSLKESYLSNSFWANYADRIDIIENYHESYSFFSGIELSIGPYSHNEDVVTIDDPMITHVTSGLFSGCINLRRVNLPNVTQIDSGAFNGCYNLRYISMPKLQSIHSQALISCAQLRELTFMNVSSETTFAILLGHVMLRSVTIGASYLSNISNTFGAEYYFPNLETISNYFMNTNYNGVGIQLELLSFPNLKTISLASTMYTGSLSFIFFPKLSNIGTSYFFSTGCRLNGIAYGNSSQVVNVIGSEALSILSKTPLYVPDGLLAAYKSHAFYSEYSSNIYPISEVPSEYSSYLT